jgi:hypothetical protein
VQGSPRHAERGAGPATVAAGLGHRFRSPDQILPGERSGPPAHRRHGFGPYSAHRQFSLFKFFFISVKGLNIPRNSPKLPNFIEICINL